MGIELIMGMAIGCCISVSVAMLFYWLRLSVIKEAERMINNKKTK